MLIAGFQKLSMVDYPSEPCAVVFVPYCNMNCTYCHNAHILSGHVDLIPEEEVFAYLDRRRGLLHAVVISGGEPTLQQGLETFISAVRELGYHIKLDTNGSRPDVLKRLLSIGYLDYVAMDLKASIEKYDAVTRVKNDSSLIRRSILMLMNSGVPYEFRTTFAPELSVDDLLSAADLIMGTQKYYLQQYRIRTEDDPAPHLPSEVLSAADAVRQKLGVCEVRGL